MYVFVTVYYRVTYCDLLLRLSYKIYYNCLKHSRTTCVMPGHHNTELLRLEMNKRLCYGIPTSIHRQKTRKQNPCNNIDRTVCWVTSFALSYNSALRRPPQQGNWKIKNCEKKYFFNKIFLYGKNWLVSRTSQSTCYYAVSVCRSAGSLLHILSGCIICWCVTQLFALYSRPKHYLTPVASFFLFTSVA